jgi:hypothetical protein
MLRSVRRYVTPPILPLFKGRSEEGLLSLLVGMKVRVTYFHAPFIRFVLI